MNAIAKIKLLDSLIKNEKGYIRWKVILAIVPLVFGIFSSVALFLFTKEIFSTEGMEIIGKGIKTAPGVMGSVLAAFPTKDFFNCKNTLHYYDYIQTQYELIQEDETLLSEVDRKELDERFNKILDKKCANWEE